MLKPESTDDIPTRRCYLGSETRRAEWRWEASWLAEWSEVWLSLGGKGETAG
jgi:hypothetical protein